MSSQRASVIAEFVETESYGLTTVGTLRGHRVTIWGPDWRGRYQATTGELRQKINTGLCDSRGNAIVALAKRLP